MQLNRAIIQAAIVGFERQKESIDEIISELRAQLDGTPGTTQKTKVAEATTPFKARRRISAAGRKRIAEAQRARWALQKRAAPEKKVVPARKTAAVQMAAPKRKLSAAAKAKLVENLKKARAAKAAKKAA
jgi:hypothetical protein